MRSPSDLVLHFLRSIGRPAEAELYLELFRAEAPERFALIAVDPALGLARPPGDGGDDAGVAAEALALDLRYLVQLDLAPVLALASAAEAERLRLALAPSVRAVVVGPDGAALVARAGGLALVVLPPAAPGAADPLAVLAAALVSRKIVLLGPRTGLGEGAGALSLVDLTTEYDAAVATLPPDDAALLARVGQLIDAVPHPLTVSITSPLALLRELFTVRGAGTLVRRGAQVRRHDDLAGIDRARLAALIEASFGRPLRPAFFDRPIERVYVADDHRGVAVVTAASPAPYLSKFAVEARARGEGVGRDLWRALCRDYPAFFWRSRPDNPIAPWYQQQCDGMARIDPWQAFWRGLPDRDICPAIEAARAAPADFDD